MERSDYFDELARCRHLFVEEMGELRANQFRLLIVVGEVATSAVPIHVAGQSLGEGFPVEVDENSTRYEFIWSSYVLYQIVNESYAKSESAETTESNLSAYVYTTSNLLHFVSKASIATDEYPGNLLHFRILCEDHIVDVISVEHPQCRKIEPKLRVN